MAVGMIDILPAVIIEIRKASAPAHQHAIRPSKLSLQRYVFPNQVAFVVIQRAVIAGEVSCKDIHSPIVVVVRYIDSHARLLATVSAQRQSTDHPFLLKGSIPSIEVQVVRF